MDTVVNRGVLLLLGACVMLFGSSGCSGSHYAVRTFSAEDGSSVTRLTDYDPVSIVGVGAVTDDHNTYGFTGVKSDRVETRMCNIAIEKRGVETNREKFYFVLIYTGQKALEFRNMSLTIEGQGEMLSKEPALEKKPRLIDRYRIEQEVYYRISREDLLAAAKARSVGFEVEVEAAENLEAALGERTIESIRRFVDEHVSGVAQ